MSHTLPPATPFTSLQSLPEGYRALVIGSTGAIGSAFLAHLQADPRCALALGLGNFERMRAHDVHLLAASLSPHRRAWA